MRSSRPDIELEDTEKYDSVNGFNTTSSRKMVFRLTNMTFQLYLEFDKVLWYIPGYTTTVSIRTHQKA